MRSVRFFFAPSTALAALPCASVPPAGREVGAIRVTLPARGTGNWRIR